MDGIAAGLAAPNADDVARLRRMKTLATALLVLAAALYAFTVAYGTEHGAWVGYLRAASEAAMVGGLADWFAVTALFRHPLGLPIPHTALIPRQKDALAAKLGGFVTGHFLTGDLVLARVRAAAPVQKLAEWLGKPGRPERASREIAKVAADLLKAVDERELTDYVLELVRNDQLRRSYSPVLGRLMEQTIAGETHRPLVDMLIERSRALLLTNRDLVRRELKGLMEQKSWIGWLIASDKRINKWLDQAAEFLAEMDGNADHPLRTALDNWLRLLADDLQRPSDTSRSVDAVIATWLDDPKARAILSELVGDAADSVRASLLDPSGALVERIAAVLARLADRLRTDSAFIARLDGAIDGVVSYAVENYGDTLTTMITEQVSSWSGADTARRIETWVGRDLQFIRLNGTAVGALAGLTIYALTQLA